MHFKIPSIITISTVVSACNNAPQDLSICECMEVRDKVVMVKKNISPKDKRQLQQQIDFCERTYTVNEQYSQDDLSRAAKDCTND